MTTLAQLAVLCRVSPTSLTLGVASLCQCYSKWGFGVGMNTVDDPCFVVRLRFHGFGMSQCRYGCLEYFTQWWITGCLFLVEFLLIRVIWEPWDKPKLSFFCSWFLYINKNPFNYKVLEKFRQHWSHLSPSYHCLKTFECTLHLDACISISQILPLCFTYGHSLQTNFFSQMMKTDIVYMSIKSQLCTIQWENFE